MDHMDERIQQLNNELEDVVENMIYLLNSNDIRDINTLNFHFEVNRILNKISYLEQIKFNNKY